MSVKLNNCCSILVCIARRRSGLLDRGNHPGPSCQRPDYFIQWISHHLAVSICAKISVFPRLQANMHTLTTVKFGSVQEPWTTFNMKYILDPE